MKAPDKIYVNIPGDYWHPGTDDKVNTDTEYARKDALLDWAKEKQEQMKIEAGGCSNMLAAGKFLAFKELIEKIESL